MVPLILMRGYDVSSDGQSRAVGIGYATPIATFWLAGVLEAFGEHTKEQAYGSNVGTRDLPLRLLGVTGYLLLGLAVSLAGWATITL